MKSTTCKYCDKTQVATNFWCIKCGKRIAPDRDDSVQVSLSRF